jgi:hypothetical protein
MLPAYSGLSSYIAVPQTRVHPVNNLHDVMGSEVMDALISNMRFYSYDTKSWFGHDYCQVHSLERDEEKKIYRIIFSFKGSGRHWVEFSERNSRFAFVTLDDYEDHPKYLLQLWREQDTAQSAGYNKIIRVHASLALENTGMLGTAAKLWFKYRSGDIATAVSLIDGSFATEVLQGKSRSPLAALIAAHVLLRSVQTDLLLKTDKSPQWVDDRWLLKLSKYPNVRSDALALFAQQEWSSGHSEEESLYQLNRELLPFTTEAMSYAKVLLDEHDNLTALRKRIENSMKCLQPGGFFCVFTNPEGRKTDFSPELMMPE